MIDDAQQPAPSSIQQDGAVTGAVSPGSRSGSEKKAINISREDDTTGGIIPSGFIKVYSSRGLEYWLMLLAFAVVVSVSISLIADIIDFAFGNTTAGFGDDGWVFVEAAGLVAAVIFMYFYSRLTAAEKVTPRLLNDPSRKRAFQIGVRLSFIFLVAGIITLIGTLFKLAYGLDFQELDASLTQQIITIVVSTGLLGGAFGYLLSEERKGGRQ